MIRAAASGSVFVPLAACVSFALSGLLVSAALFGEDGVNRHDKLRAEIAALEGLNQELDAENERLAAEAAALRDDSRYIEATARDELGWVRSDEVIFIVPSSPEEPSTPPAAAAALPVGSKKQLIQLAEVR